MKEDVLKKGQELLEELNELRKIDKLLTDDKHRRNVNVQFHQHFGECTEYERVLIHKEHTSRFIKVLREIIQEIEQEIRKL